jgi:AcrR family transcriptional regulator
MQDLLEDVSLREKKFIKTKVALMNAFIERLKTTRMADVSIKDVCRSVEVSEGTFYNYFPRKIDLVYYFHQLFEYKIIYQARRSVHGTGYLELIDAVFQMIAENVRQPSLFLEFISIITGEKEHPGKIRIAPLEISFALPECPGIAEDMECVCALEDFLLKTLQLALQHKELPRKINVPDVCIHLFSIMVGAAVALEPKDFSQLGRYYKEHVRLLWKAIGRV